MLKNLVFKTGLTLQVLESRLWSRTSCVVRLKGSLTCKACSTIYFSETSAPRSSIARPSRARSWRKTSCNSCNFVSKLLERKTTTNLDREKRRSNNKKTETYLRCFFSRISLRLVCYSLRRYLSLSSAARRWLLRCHLLRPLRESLRLFSCRLSPSSPIQVLGVWGGGLARLRFGLLKGCLD